ncbi:hypothetical protein QBC35DRAFT_348241, partial [Podospora australis]
PSANMASTAAAEAPAALTTPFSPPQSCVDQFVTTSFVSDSSTVTLLASGPVDSQFSACQPSGWDAGGSSSNFHFSPAVCPSGWTAYELGADGQSSTARCCSSGFALSLINNLRIDGFPDMVCAQATTLEDSQQSVLRVHNEWFISWASSDVPSLTPAPPQPACSTSRIPTWIPGDNAVDLGSPCTGTPNNDVPSHQKDAGVALFLMIGLPLIFVAII